MMNSGKKIAVALGIAAMFSTVFSESEAAKIDAYRDIILSGAYTIRYDNITPPSRKTNRDKLPLYGNSGMAVDKNDYLTNKQRSGVVVMNGEDRYEEVGDGTFSQCRLTKGKEIFNFTKYPQKDNPKLFEYMGIKKNKVQAVQRNYLAEAMEGRSYGDTEVSKLINAMLPANKKRAGMMSYNFVKGGALNNGLYYEDYKGSSGNLTGVIRYYFSGDALVKIAAAEYYRGTDGKLYGVKTIVNVKEFSSTPDIGLLKLPEGVKDETKRDKK